MSLHDLFIKDLAWKLFSIALALTIWLTVHKILQESEPLPILPPQPQQATKTFNNLPVLIVSAAADVRDFHVTPTMVTVSVSGPPDTILGLRAAELHPLVNLTDAETGHDLRRPVEVSMPPGVALETLDPAEVSVIVPPQHKK